MSREARQQYLDEIYAMDNAGRRQRSVAEVVIVLTIWVIIVATSVLVLVGSVLGSLAVVRHFWS
jgi:hypothetical protein